MFGNQVPLGPGLRQAVPGTCELTHHLRGLQDKTSPGLSVPQGSQRPRDPGCLQTQVPPGTLEAHALHQPSCPLILHQRLWGNRFA